ncbi:MAG: PAS domain-containing protein [Pleurocapsa sp. MO_226.B13]|nr:PAS domain-containing protein [Pleurocapsa sp. MO_226.B13]
MLANSFFSLEQVIDRQPLIVTSQTPLTEVISLMQEWGNSCSFGEEGKAAGAEAIETDNSCALVVESDRANTIAELRKLDFSTQPLRLRGVFTERDLVRLVAEGVSIKSVTVGEVMSQNIVTITLTGEEDTFSALNLFRKHGIRHLPVIDNCQNLVGLITAKSLRRKLQPINLMQWRKVAEIMKTAIVYASPDDSVKQVAKLMSDRQISCVAIAESELDSQGNSLVRPVGIITERDIVQFQNLDLDLEQPARKLMSTPLFLVSPEDTLWSIYQQMQQRRVRRLLVVGKQGELVGIVTQTSLLRVFDPAEMYGLIEILQREVCELESERTQLLESRQAELETQVKEQTANLEVTNQLLQSEIDRRQQSQKRFDSILNSIEDVVYSVDPNTFELFYLNAAAEKVYGRRVAEFYENCDLWLEIVHPEDRDRTADFGQNAIETGVGEAEYRIIRPDGEIRWLYDRAHITYDVDGIPVRFDGSVTDITQRKQAEISLQESRERYALALEGSSNGLWDWNVVTDEVFYAPRFKAIIGYSDAEMSNTFEAWSSKLHPEDGDRVLTAVQNHLEDRVPFDIEYRLQVKTGEYRWIQARGQAIWDRDGRAIRMAGSITDISDRKGREAILKDIASGISVEVGANFLVSLVQYLSQALGVDYAYVGKLIEPAREKIKTQAVYGRGQILDNFEYDLAGTPCSHVVEQHLCVYPQGVRQLFPESLLLSVMKAESFAGMPIVDTVGKVVGLLAIVDSKPFDDLALIEEVLKIFVTRIKTELERQQAEVNLHRSNRILQAISSIQTQFLTDTEPNILFDGILGNLLELTESEYGFIGEILIADDGNPIMEESYMKFRGRSYLKTNAITNIAWNEETRKFYAENAPKGMEFHNLETLFGAVIVTGDPVIANSPSTDPRRGSLPDGHPPLNAFLGVPFYKNNKMTGMVGVANREDGYDETIIHYLRPFLDTCSRIIEAYQNERQKQQVEAKNREQAALLDVATDAIMVRGLDAQILFWNRGAEKIYGWTEQEALGRDANKLLYSQSLTMLAEIMRSLYKHGHWQGELQQVTKTGQKIIVESRWTLVTNEAKDSQSILVVNTDITEQKQLQAQFLRTQRLESLGTLAGGIAHDLNNILAPILGFARLLPRKLPDVDEQTKGFFQIIENNAQRGTALVKQILTFSRGLEGDKGVVQIRHLISEISQIILETFPKSIELETSVPKNLWTVNGDINQLHQILMNLAVNARDAMPDRGKLIIKAENITLDREYTRLHLDAREGAYVLITVTDNGVGIAPEIIDRIFEPFFTTKEIGRGTGLGLSTVIGIVKSHDGFVDVISNTTGRQRGTQVKVFLPALQTTALPAAEPEILPQGKGELILVVDDEPAILAVTKATLETYNYKVLTANNGIEAIAVYVQNIQAIELVIMDIMMPSMDGKTAIRTLKQIDPEVKIIAVSGLISGREITTEVDGDITAFLAKPYNNDDLLKTIQEII